MVKAMHAAGIEVILDVVYNHTAEGNHLGPTLSFKGIDNQAYYRLVEDDQQYYMDYTGTGNSLNVRHPHSLQLIMDSLRYWVTEMHVDGFRFDLASTLAREFYEVDRLSTFFELVQQDPVVSQVKLIAEPWDVGPGGYQVGNFPPQWTEWNGAYRDTVRDFWRGEPSLGEFASRLAGSSDFYENSGRRPFASINFVTAHDGFTLHDLVSYNEKHNEANGEDNNDGESHNRSWNHGVEGPTDDPEIQAARAREQRNLLATLLLSQGVPMIAHGDELGRTQQGNNNTYAQDSELSWVHWDQADLPLVEFTAALSRLRAEHPTFRRKRFFTGDAVRTGEASGSTTSSGCTPTAAPWRTATGATVVHAIGMYLNGHGIAGKDARGETIIDDHFLLFFNVGDALEVTLPPAEYAEMWDVVIDTGGVGRRRHRYAGRVDAADGRATRWSCSASTASPRPSPTTRWPRRSLPGPIRATRARPARAAMPEPAAPDRRTPRAPSHLSAADHVGLRPVRGCPTAALPARPGRRLGLPLAAARRRAGQHARLRRGRLRPRRPVPRWRRRAGGAVGRGPPARHGRARRHRAEPRRRRHPGAEPWWWDVLEHGPGSRLRRGVRHRLGVRPRQAAASRRSVTTTSATTGPTGHLDDRATSCATTTTGSRSLPARRRHPRRGARAQHYELVGWRRGDADLNYRRFFTVSTLAGVRVEEPEVFADTHVEIRRWFDEGLVDGLRIDHPDGLRDPEGYLDHLADLTGGAYTLVEKILEPGEDLRSGLGDGRHHRLRRARAPRPGAHRPCRRAAARRARAPAARRRRRLARSCPRPQARRGRREPARRDPADRARAARPAARRRPSGWRTRSPRCWPASRSTAPTSPTARDHLDEAFAAARQHRADLGAASSTCSRRCWTTRRPTPRCGSSRRAGW